MGKRPARFIVRRSARDRYRKEKGALGGFSTGVRIGRTQGKEELHQGESDGEKEEQMHNDGNQSINYDARVSPSGLDPASFDFEVPFPSKSAFKFEPENSEEEFSPPFPT